MSTKGFTRRKPKRPTSVEELFQPSKEKKKSLSKATPRSKTTRHQNQEAKPEKLDPFTGQEKSQVKSKMEKQREAFGLHPSEEQEHIAVIQWAKLQKYKNRLLSNHLHHSPNGGNRSMREGRAFKEMGTQAGWPDLILTIARGPFHGLFLEMKAAKGSVSVAQHEYHPLLIEEGYKVVVCYSAQAAIETIKNYMFMSN